MRMGVHACSSFGSYHLPVSTVSLHFALLLRTRLFSQAMAAELCVPGCLVCQFRPCPACRGEALCELCWTDLQDILWFEEWEAEGVAGDDGDSEHELVGAAGEEALFAGTPATCPPTSETDMDFAEAASPGS